MSKDNVIYELILSDEQHTHLLACLRTVWCFYSDNADHNPDFWGPRASCAEDLFRLVLNAMPIDLDAMEKEARDHAPG